MFGLFKNKDKKVKEVAKLLYTEGVPLIKAFLNGKKTYFLLDTGASTSMLDISQSQDFSFEVFGESDVEITGIGGKKMTSYNLSKTSIVIDSKLHDISFTGKDLSQVTNAIKDASGYKIAGVIGNNVISSEKWVIDLNKNIVWKY